MQAFSLNVAKSFLGKNVNIHLKDGSVVVNVQIAEVRRDDDGRGHFLRCVTLRRGSRLNVPLATVAWAECLNPDVLLTCG